jgi:hypothetical protein
MDWEFKNHVPPAAFIAKYTSWEFKYHLYMRPDNE